ncbi:hypothetical protein GQ55_1G101300 [Panicum hallii var. hallii]|uniref:Uncharacterized protein n=1 Tax=Panicum hallii var. hallii TaxID=1504633 RepID=A0A2T7F465_9POAL|nr:hypothetical protein GQ55_1G101300 [Panicum hallii var. hallii]
MGIQRSWLDHPSPSPPTRAFNRPLVRLLLLGTCTGTADFLEKAGRARRRALHGEQGNTSWGWARRSTKKPQWLYQWRLALPCLHLFVLLRKRDMGDATHSPVQNHHH